MSSTAPATGPADRHLRLPALPSRWTSGWRAQLLLFAPAYLLYVACRWIFAGDLDVATANAHAIIALEQRLGIAVEPSVQQAFALSWERTLLSNLYLAAQLVVLPGSLIWLYHRAPPIYRHLRDTVLATWIISIPVYALFPVAPPRLVSAVADPVADQAASALTGKATIFYNELAAVPSLHVGFALAIGIALAAAFKRPLARVLALLWGPAVTLIVIATANHYTFDAVVGAGVVTAGWFAGRAVATAAEQRRLPVADASAEEC